MSLVNIIATYMVMRQNWEESERGWGVRPDGYSLHANEEHRQRFIDEYWKGMPDEVPDEYSRPAGEPHWITTDRKTYEEVVKNEPGVRRWR